MAIKGYGLLKGRPIEIQKGTGSSPHYQVRIVDDTTDFRIAINVKSQSAPSEVEFIAIDRFEHPLIDKVKDLPKGFTPLASNATSGALDFIRGNLFDRTKMVPLPANLPGVDNDLDDKIDRVMQRALGDEKALVYAFGQRWGPEAGKKDQYFGFLPGNGIHDIHMNQGNDAHFAGDDGVWQDGGLIVSFPGEDQWSAIFLKFQSQTWHTDDHTGHRLAGSPSAPPPPAHPGPPPSSPPPPSVPAPKPPLPNTGEPHGLIRIVAALVNAVESPEVESVTLLNTSPRPIALAGWALLDTQRKKLDLSGTIGAGQALAVMVKQPYALSNKGGTISLLDDAGLKVDGVSYTKAQADNPGWTLVF